MGKLVLLLIGIFHPGFVIGQNTVKDSTVILQNQYVLFDSDKWELDATDSMEIEKSLIKAQKIKQAYFEVSAHTDGDGSEYYNLLLSEKRCQSVLSLLRNSGVDSLKIKSKFYGEARPIGSNKTDKGKAINRRAQILLKADIKILEIDGFLKSKISEQPISNAMIILHSRFMRDTTRTDIEGRFLLTSPVNEVIGLDALAEGHMFNTTMIKVQINNQHNINLTLDKIAPGKSIDLNRFFFVGNKAIILEEYVPELENLERFMKINDQTCIEIIGHVNHPNYPPVDSSSFEFNLSVARSKLIYEKMISVGIAKSRMFHTGKGNWEMLFPKAKNRDEMRKNRRVEIVVRNCEDVQIANNDVINYQYNFYRLEDPKK